MAIAFITSTEKNNPFSSPEFLNHWLEAFSSYDSQLDIRLWPDVGNLDDITFALVWRHPYGSLNQLPNLKAIASLGAGVDHIMGDPNLPNNIPIARVVDKTMAKEMTQYAVAATLNYIKRFDHWDACQQQNTWGQKPPFSLSKTHVGIMGLGYLGKHIARALSNLEVHVSAWSRSKKTLDNIQCFAGDAELDIFLSQSDVLICMLPLTPKTKNLLNTKTLSQLPHEAYVINVARGPILVDEDLIELLDNDHLSGARLDVFREEPLPKEHPFWTHPKIHLTPHIASVTNADSVVPQIVDNYYRALKGEKLSNLINVTHGY